MNIDLNTVAQGLAGKLAAAGIIAAASSVLSTYILRNDIEHLTKAFQEFRQEVREDMHNLRKDLYVPASKPSH